jgi:hypothetical protein
MAGASNNDAAVHDRFWDDELVYTSSAGTRFGKPEILSGLRGPAGPGGTGYKAEEIDVRRHGEIAVITFRLVASHADETRQEYFNTACSGCGTASGARSPGRRRGSPRLRQSNQRRWRRSSHQHNAIAPSQPR